MVVYVLYVKAELIGVASLALKPEANLCVSVRNPLDHNEVRDNIVIDGSALEPEFTATNHHADKYHEEPCHFALKWRDAPTRATVRVLGVDDDVTTTTTTDKATKKKQSKKQQQQQQRHTAATTTRAMTAGDGGDYVPLLALDCRGLEPYAFRPLGGEFVATTKGGETVSPDLSQGDWSEHDLGHGLTSVSNLESKFE